MKSTTIKNRILFILAVIVTGAFAGAFVWAFIFVLRLGLSLLWERLPEAFGSPFFYPLIVCLIGGVVVGLYEKKFGPYPKELNEVIGEVKAKGRFEYNDIGIATGAALLPLIFGGSIGPEAGLTGTIAGLCTWVGDRMKRFGADFQNLTSIGISAALSAIFAAPLFGFVAPIYGSAHKVDDREELVLPKTQKIVVYMCAIAGAFGIIMLLNEVTGSAAGLPRFSDINVGTTELIWVIPLILAGSLGGWLYHIFNGVSDRISKKMGDRPVLKAIIAGIVLALFGMFLPYTMFSGESQIELLEYSWETTAIVVLFLTGLIKLFVTPFCIRMGWRGGHFFPMIFAGISIAYGFAAISGADPVFCMCAVCAAVCGGVMRQPLMAVLLLFLCFPIKGVVIMFVAAVIGSVIPLPKAFAPEQPRKKKLPLTKKETSE